MVGFMCSAKQTILFWKIQALLAPGLGATQYPGCSEGYAPLALGSRPRFARTWRLEYDLLSV